LTAPRPLLVQVPTPLFLNTKNKIFKHDNGQSKQDIDRKRRVYIDIYLHLGRQKTQYHHFLEIFDQLSFGQNNGAPEEVKINTCENI